MASTNHEAPQCAIFCILLLLPPSSSSPYSWTPSVYVLSLTRETKFHTHIKTTGTVTAQVQTLSMLCRQQWKQACVNLADYNSTSCNSKYVNELNCCHAVCNGYVRFHKICKQYMGFSAFICDMAQTLRRSRWNKYNATSHKHYNTTKLQLPHLLTVAPTHMLQFF